MMTFSLMDCDLELFNFVDNCFSGFKHIKNIVFLLILHFCCNSVCDFGIRMWSVRHRPSDFSANFGSKSLSLFGWWQGGEGSRQTVLKGGGKGGQRFRFLRWYTFWMVPNCFYFVFYFVCILKCKCFKI